MGGRAEVKDGTPLGMGLGWFLGRDDEGKYGEHSGGSPCINSLLRFYPGSKLVVVVLGHTNDYNPSQLLKYTAIRVVGYAVSAPTRNGSRGRIRSFP